MKTFSALVGAAVVSSAFVMDTAHAVAPGASSQVFSNVFGDNLVLDTCMDDQQNLYASSNAPRFGSYVSVFKITPSGSTAFKVDIQQSPDLRRTYPSSIDVVGDTVVVLSGESFLEDTGSVTTAYFLNPADGSIKADPLTIIGATFVENGVEKTSQIYGVKLVQSTTNPTKVYAIGNAAGTSVVVRFDISTQTIDWTTNFVSADGEGGTVEDAIEVGSYLWVASNDGLSRLDLATGVRVDETMPAGATMPGYKLIPFQEGNKAYVLLSGYHIVSCIDVDTLQVRWTRNGVGILQPDSLFGPASSSDTSLVWFARNVIPSTGGSTSEWDVEAGVLSTATGAVQWKYTYKSGGKNNLIDNMVGFYQHAQGSALRVMEEGQIQTGYWFWRRTTNVVRLLTFDHDTRSVSSAVTIEKLGAPSEYVGKGSVSWGTLYSGAAVKYTHSAPAAGRVGVASTTLNELDDGFPRGPSAEDMLAFIGLALAPVALIAGVAVGVRRRRRQQANVVVVTGAQLEQQHVKSSDNPMFEL